MSSYVAPLKDMMFVLTELAGLDKVAALPGYEEATTDVVEAILDESAKFTGGVLAPINWSGDQEGAKWADKAVTMPRGSRKPMRRFVDNGWNALGGNPEFGGQGLPKVVSAAVQEMWKSANMSFSLCPLLTLGAIEALELAGTDAQKAMYLPNMVPANGPAP
jgi:alkylation response protein AidB-like acyl-CoA dehydrogenase